MADQKKWLSVSQTIIISFIVLIAGLFFVSCNDDDDNDEAAVDTTPHINYFYSTSGTLSQKSGNNYELKFNNISNNTYAINKSSEGFEETRQFFSEKYKTSYAKQNPHLIVATLDQNDTPIDAHFLTINSLKYDSSAETLTLNVQWVGSSVQDLSPASGLTFENSAVIIIPTGYKPYTVEEISYYPPAPLFMLLIMGIQNWLHFSIETQNDSIQNTKDQIANNNQQIYQLNEARTALDNTAPPDDSIPTYPVETMRAEIDTQIDNLNAVNTDLSNTQQMEMINLQQLMDARNNCLTQITNVLRQDQKIRVGIIRNLS
jgi:hypothetical protein